MGDIGTVNRWVFRAGLGLFAAALFVSCSDAEPDEANSSATDAAEVGPETGTDATISTGTGTEPETTVAGSDTTGDSAPPASRADANPSTNEVDHWIGRGLMTASSIELVWSPVEGAESYRIHRFERVGGFDPDDAAFADASLVYDGPASTTTDDDVVEGTFYTYVLDVQMADGSLARRWTEGLARDDTTPPAPITNLRAESTADGVLLSWDRSLDDVEFASYAVSIVEEDQLRYIGGGGDVEQSSFLDTRPPDGIVTYSVQAVDFHDNRTEPAIVEFSDS